MKVKKMSLPDFFDKDYYEDGRKSGKSFYENYRWMPHLSLPMANKLKELYPKSSFLDFGCAKGYLVHAFRLLDVEAYGYDISKYAISNSKKEAKKYLFCDEKQIPKVDVVVSKDVLEHVPYDRINDTLTLIHSKCDKAIIVVPFGDDGLYRIPSYELDKSHFIREDEEWWISKFKKAGFKISSFHYHLTGFKDHWTKIHPHGNGFFRLEK